MGKLLGYGTTNRGRQTMWEEVIAVQQYLHHKIKIDRGGQSIWLKSLFKENIIAVSALRSIGQILLAQSRTCKRQDFYRANTGNDFSNQNIVIALFKQTGRKSRKSLFYRLEFTENEFKM